MNAHLPLAPPTGDPQEARLDSGKSRPSTTAEAPEGPSRARLKPAWHFFAIALIIASALFLFYKSFSAPGTIMHTDMTWPNSIPRIHEITLHMWLQYTSMTNAANMQRVLWVMPLLYLAELLRLSVTQYVFLLFVTTFALAGISMYALAYRVIGRIANEDTSRYAVMAGAVLAGIVYMYNPWSIGHMWSYFIYPPYALLPLVFLVLMTAIKHPTPRNTIVLGFLLALGCTHPQGVIWAWLVVITYALFHILKSRFSRSSLRSVTKMLGLTGLVFVLLSAIWLVPYLAALAVNKPMVATYSAPVSQGMIDALSINNTTVNSLRLVAGWQPGFPIELVPTQALTIILSFFLPIAAIASLVVLRDRIRDNEVINYWSIIFVISILLTTGSMFVLRHPYSYVVLEAPGSSVYGWMFRAPDRWLLFTAFFYSLTIGALLAWLARGGLSLPSLQFIKGKVGES